jgi:hypothetical protein
VTRWDNDTFADEDFKGLLTGELIANVIEHSINKALSSLSLIFAEYTNLELVAGIWCPSHDRHELYIYKILNRIGDEGILILYTEKHLIAEDKVVVLGLSEQFESDAQTKFLSALNSHISPADEMYKFLNDSIDIMEETGSKEISKPTFSMRLNRCKITQNN